MEGLGWKGSQHHGNSYIAIVSLHAAFYEWKASYASIITARCWCKV